VEGVGEEGGPISRAAMHLTKESTERYIHSLFMGSSLMATPIDVSMGLKTSISRLDVRGKRSIGVVREGGSREMSVGISWANLEMMV